MHAVVSLLDEAYMQMALTLADELDERFGVRAGAKAVRYPHFSYQGAEQYDLAALEATLRKVARETQPFRVYADGLGVFTGPHPVLYVPVARGPELARLHETLWRELSPASEDASPYYSPHQLVAHITLAQWDIHADNLGAIVSYLSERTLEWEIAVDNLALLYQEAPGTRGEVRLRIPFGAAVDTTTTSPIAPTQAESPDMPADPASTVEQYEHTGLL
ncbi:MAG: 2'-5' RNA ligase family protein [Ktedonobacterales bacterium]